MNYLKFFEPHVKGLKKAGAQFKGYCPFHNDEGSEKKGFSLNAEKGLWHCFSCGAEGNVFSFFKQLNSPIPEELQSNSPPEWRGYNYPKYRSPKKEVKREWEPETLLPPNEKWQEKASYLIKLTIAILTRSPKCEEIRHSLMTERGLNGEALNRLGWNPQTIYYSKDSWGLEDSGDLWIPRGIVIPVIQDRCIQRLQIRTHDEGDHILLPGSCSKAPMRLVSGNRCAIVVESDLDALLLWRVAGDLVDVFALRSASNRPDVNSTEILRKAEKVYVSLDSDSAGRENSQWWLSHFPNAKNFPLPPGKGKDPGEAFKKGFNLRGWIREEVYGNTRPNKETSDVSAINASSVGMKYSEEEKRNNL